MQEPFDLFLLWYGEAMAANPGDHRGAVCLSALDEEGFPDGRFVDFKGLHGNRFIFCTHLDSPKSRAIEAHAKVALTFWWDHLGRQVRVRGLAKRIGDTEADAFFQARPREARLTAWTSRQSSPLTSMEALEQRFHEMRRRFSGAEVPRPDHWGGYGIEAVSIEFLAFRDNRLHRRTRYRRSETAWTAELLQP